MSKAKVLLMTAVTFNGSIVEAGEELELGTLSAQALIDEGKAKPTDAENVTEAPNSGEDENQQLTPSDDPENEAGEELDKIRKALNDKYNRDPLAEAAKEAEVEFPYDAKKGEIIEAVITAGKAEALLAK